MSKKASTDEQALLDIARDAIAAALAGRTYSPPRLGPPFGDMRRAVFVTLREPTGELRGCIGRTEPACATVAEEIADSAVSAATRDPRFPPVEPRELARLQVEISLLEPPEPVRTVQELDAQEYGVVVIHGARRGVLLPALEGVDTPQQQLAIALHKAGIYPDSDYRIERFRVRKVPGG